MKQNRPHLMINMAMSLDGKVSSRSREPTTFTSREDKRLLVEIRSRCDALIVAARTAGIDYTTMGIPNEKLRRERVARGQAEHPIRVLVSGRLNLSPHLKLFDKPISPILIFCSEQAPAAKRHLFEKKGTLIVCGKTEVNVPRMTTLLHKKYHAKVLLCEGGPTLNDAFFRAKLVDELFVTLCPVVVGGEKAPTLVDGVGVPRLGQAKHGKLIDCRKGGQEWFLQYRFPN